MKKKQRSFWVSLVAGGPARARLGRAVPHRDAPGPRSGPRGGRLGDPVGARRGRRETVMNQALENIRNRIDAFGTAEPLLVRDREHDRGADPRARARHARGAREGAVLHRRRARGTRTRASTTRTPPMPSSRSATVQPVVSSVCLTDDLRPTSRRRRSFGQPAPCAGTEQDCRPPRCDGDPPSRSSRGSSVCRTPASRRTPCYPTQAKAEDGATRSIETVTSQSFCIQSTGKQTLTSDVGAACAQAEADAQTLLDGMTIKSVGHGVLRDQLGRGGPRLLPRPVRPPRPGSRRRVRSACSR